MALIAGGWRLFNERSLPAQIAVARVRVAPGVHEVDVDVGNRRHRFSVTLDGAFAVMSVRQMGTSAYMSVSPVLPRSATAAGTGARGATITQHTVSEGML